MLEENKTLYSLEDVIIVPSEITEIRSRSECCPFVKSIYKNCGEFSYPIFTAPMSSVIDEGNYKTFLENKINSIIPRSVNSFSRRGLCKDLFCAFSLKETQEFFIDEDVDYDLFYVLIDIANGHMRVLLDLCKCLKKKYGSRIKIMTGNIANPRTLIYYNEAGIDYVRISVGSGFGCITTCNTGVGYGMASLISETAKIKREIDGTTRIIADGGINSYSDCIKALALGADYVMMGRVFGSCLEACGEIFELDSKGRENYVKDKTKLTNEDLKLKDYYRKYYGMASKIGQADILGVSLEEAKNQHLKLKTAEGRIRNVKVEYTLSSWVDNFDSYLRSAMSYVNATFLNGMFQKKAKVVVISKNTSDKINNK